jgi:hypothetical protein
MPLVVSPLIDLDSSFGALGECIGDCKGEFVLSHDDFVLIDGSVILDADGDNLILFGLDLD